MDPRLGSDPMTRRGGQSTLLAAKSRSNLGEKVNFCPHGCQVEDLDDNGYCRHLIGFTNDGKTYEPMIVDERGRRVVRARGKDGADLRKPVRESDRLERISISSRVYRRNVEAESWGSSAKLTAAPEEAATEEASEVSEGAGSSRPAGRLTRLTAEDVAGEG